MRSYRHIEILEPHAASFQTGFDITEYAADLIAPRSSHKLGAEDVEPPAETLLPGRPRHSGKPVLDLSDDRLRQENIGFGSRR